MYIRNSGTKQTKQKAMSWRRKFTFPERQLEACREPLGFMQTEIGAVPLRSGAGVLMWCLDEVLS